MARSAAQTRQRILDAAYGLFWRQGFVRASLDDIAEGAGITKRTLYQHFRSKDDLIADVLAQSSKLAMERLQRISDRMPDGPEAMIDSFFGQLSEWAAKPRWSGTGFTRVVAELADLPGHPARTIARQHKARVEAWLADLLAKSNVSSPVERAREMTLLMEGAMSLMLIHGDRSYADAAARAAKQLVKQ
ncbi:MAG: helix-turn-helix domain-containing protein [Bradyrhizobium sp.]